MADDSNMSGCDVSTGRVPLGSVDPFVGFFADKGSQETYSGYGEVDELGTEGGPSPPSLRRMSPSFVCRKLATPAYMSMEHLTWKGEFHFHKFHYIVAFIEQTCDSLQFQSSIIRPSGFAPHSQVGSDKGLV